MFDALLDPSNLVALLTLTILEIVLGIDNVIFIAIVAQALPAEQRQLARRVGLGLALLGRILMVLGISWLLRLDSGLFTALGHEFSFSDLILIAGGAFLIYKATREIYLTTELLEEAEGQEGARKASFGGVVSQIVIIDMIFAIDSVLTAVGLTKEIILIVIAITIAIGVMMFYAGPLADFIHKHPSLKVLALAFLEIIGLMLILDGFGQHVDRGYVYAAILFGLLVEALNLRRGRNLSRRQGPERPEPTV